MKVLKKMAALILAVACAASVSACVPTEHTMSSIGPDFSSEPGALEEVQFYNDTLAAFENTQPYAFVRDIDIQLNQSERNMYISIVVMDEADKDDIEHFISALLRHMNDAACMQISDVELSTQKSFGNLYDKYGYEIVVFPESHPYEEDEIVYGSFLERGEKPDYDPDIETYEEEWLEGYQRLKKNTVYDINGNEVEK